MERAYKKAEFRFSWRRERDSAFLVPLHAGILRRSRSAIHCRACFPPLLALRCGKECHAAVPGGWGPERHIAVWRPLRRGGRAGLPEWSTRPWCWRFTPSDAPASLAYCSHRGRAELTAGNQMVSHAPMPPKRKRSCRGAGAAGTGQEEGCGPAGHRCDARAIAGARWRVLLYVRRVPECQIGGSANGGTPLPALSMPRIGAGISSTPHPARRPVC